MWLIKLPFRIIFLPVMALVAIMSLLCKVLLRVSTSVIGVIFIVLGVCAFSAILQQTWMGVLIIALSAAVVFLGVMFAEAISMGLETLNKAIAHFVFS